MTDAAIKATYSDYRRVKGRKVLQLIFEVPLEQAPQVHDIFGEPAPDGSTWVAIARLTEEASKTEKPQRKWADMPKSQQAGIACEDGYFRQYLDEVRDFNLQEVDAAGAVRALCGVQSRGDLDKSQTAANLWDKLYSDYQLWKRGAAA